MELQLALTQALDAHKEGILNFSKDLIRIPSENPPGNYYRECADRIRLELERLELPYQLVEVPGFSDRPRCNLLSFYGEGERTLYFHGHYDVVPAQSREQFGPRVDKGRLFGRGSTDMKSALAETIETVIGARPSFEMCPGILETRWYARKGIPAFAYGPGFLEVAHGPSEFIEIERIYQHTLIYALAAARLL